MAKRSFFKDAQCDPAWVVVAVWFAIGSFIAMFKIGLALLYWCC